MKRLIIGITGPARSGKDTVADRLVKMFGFQRYGFADPMKKMLAVGFGLTEEHLNGGLKEVVIERFGKSPRQMMQTLGTEWGRDLVHTDAWLTLARDYCDSHPRVVVSDVRFPNEAQWVRQNGVLFHVLRPRAQSVAAHSSEGGIKFDPCADYALQNHGSIYELYRQLDGLMRGLLAC